VTYLVAVLFGLAIAFTVALVVHLLPARPAEWRASSLSWSA
jgi:hypothetical protein